MAELTAVIIAAGRGVRMGPEGRLRPKGLFEIGGATLIERSVAAMAAQGIGAIRLVTGHLAEQYGEIAPRLATPVELVHNPDFDRAGALHSLALGLAGVDGPVLVAESDVIYERRALAELPPGADRIVLSGPTGAGDEVYAWSRPDGCGGERLFDMAKDPRRHDWPHLGELVGLIGFSAAGAAALRAIAARMLADDPRTEYEAAVVEFARAHPLTCRLVPDLAWMEMDTPEMFDRAVRMVWPRIRAADGEFAASRHSGESGNLLAGTVRSPLARG